MKLYAELEPARTRQLVADGIAAAAVIASVMLGVALHGVVAIAAVPGEAMQDAGEAVGRLPGLGGAGGALADAGQTQQDAVLSLAFWLGFGVAAVGVLAVALLYLPGRLRWVREAAAAAGLRDRPGDLQLLAYRAVARRPLGRLMQAVPDPGTALASGNYHPLATVELEELGLRSPS